MQFSPICILHVDVYHKYKKKYDNEYAEYSNHVRKSNSFSFDQKKNQILRKINMNIIIHRLLIC
jgi:hypothetical protein